MLGTLRHRGPDQFGIYLGERGDCSVGLGNSRLSIVDLAGGQQPISNEDGTKWIVFNGEIFNHLELRRELEQRGHRLQSDSDTEVIVHLFEDLGPDCLQHLNGQFALAIWDERTGELFLARDRLGIRPLFYARDGGALTFASEVKGLLADPAFSVELDPLALDEIFTFWSPIAPRTAFRGVSCLPPGHYLVARSDGEVRIEKYWELTFPDRGREPLRDAEEATAEFGDLLAGATELRLRADVPVGAYLSGGLDSSTITALAQRHAGSGLETFSIAFDDQAYDESEFQRRMAARLGTRHHRITCTHEDIGRVIPEVVWHTETPITRTSPAPLYLLSELVQSEGLKVVLTGEGADEFLAGYNIFKEAKVRRFWAREPQSKRRPALLKKLYPYIGELSGAGDAYLKGFFGQGLERVFSACYSHEVRWRNTSRAKRLFSGALRAAIEEERRESDGSAAPEHEPWEGLALPADLERYSPLARAQYLEAAIFLPGYLLSSQGDRMAMAHSVEGRFPFLDHRVVELCCQLAPGLKLRGLDEKRLLKRAARDLVPAEIGQRRKRPYRAPIHASFFVEGKPLDWVAEALSAQAIEAAGCFDPGAVAMLAGKIERWGSLGETDDMALAGVLTTQLVHRQFVADFRARTPLNESDDVKIVQRRAPEGGT